MGVSLPGGGGGGGRTRSLSADLNLVPFIDFLSVCITFLLLTAVWTQISAMQVDQAVQDPNQEPPPPPDEPPTPPLTVHIRSDGIWAGREVASGTEFPKTGEDYDWVGLQGMLEGDRTTYPDEIDAVIVTDDGVEYQYMIHALDLTRGQGYEKTLLGGGPPSVAADLAPPPPAGG
jgi:biopolymer transport protein TolR